MKKHLITIVFIHIFSCFYTYSQITGGRENSQKSPSIAETGTLSGGIYSGDVNIFTGVHQSSIPLGSLSTPTGPSFNLELTRSSSFSFGGNESSVKGLLYGDGWNLNIPVITVTTDIFHRFGNGAECNDYTSNNNTNTLPSDFNRSWEGDVFWFEPYISIPGVGSGRAVFKYVDVKDMNCAVFALNKFSTPVEIRFYGTSWVVTIGDGTTYVFEGTIKQFMAPSNKRLSHYNHEDYTLNGQSEATQIIVNNEYTGGEGIVNVIEPKVYHNSWYCSRIFHLNSIGQDIIFEYQKYGEFNFFKEFQQENYRDVHRSVFQDRTSNNYLPDYTAYKDIVLQRVISSTIDGNTEIIELEYGIEDVSSIYLMKPSDPGVEMKDPMYCSKVVERFDGTSGKPFSNWYRYPHTNRTAGSPSTINPYNPYIISDNYYRESVTAITTTGVPFSHGFLESKRINTGEALIAGDLYEIRTKVSRPSGTDLKNGNGTLDIAIVTNGDDTTYAEPSGSNINESIYRKTKGEQIFSTFNMGMKWQMGYNQTVLETSNLFVMPRLPSSFQGFNIQVGPGNSDIQYNYYNPLELYYSQHASTPTEPNALVAYPQMKGNGLKSSVTIPRNFGTGHPWGMMFPIYNHRALLNASPMPNYELLYIGTWSIDGPEQANIGGTHNPTKFNETVVLKEVELIRHGRTAYMLQGVKHYRMEGEYSYGTTITEGKQLIAQKRIKYTLTHVQDRQNKNYQNGDPIVVAHNSKAIMQLTSVHEVPLEGNLYGTNFGLTDPKIVLTTSFEYTNILPASGTYSDNTPYVGLTHLALTKIVDNLGGITEIEYYPLGDASTKTYSTMNFNWNCGTYRPASYGVDKSFTTHLAVKYIIKTAADFDELTQTFVPSTQKWEYVYDVTKPTYSFKRLSVPATHFRGGYINDYDRGFAKVTVYEPELVTGEKNYTIHEFYGNVNYPYSFPATTTVSDYLYYGKPKSIKKYDNQNKIHYSKDYQYSHTLAFEDGYKRPNFFRDNLNNYYQPILDGYEYRDYYRGEEMTVNLGPTVLTGDAAKWVYGDLTRGIGELLGSDEHPKYLPFYFHHELRNTFTITDVDGIEYTGQTNPEYAFNSYFIKLVSETERVYEDGLATQSAPIPVLEPIIVKEPILPNPFGGGIIKPVATIYDSLYFTFIGTHPSHESYTYLLLHDSLSDQVLGYIGASDSFSINQKITIFCNQKGLSDNLWTGILNAYTYFPAEDLKRLVFSQPYFTDTIQKKAIAQGVNDHEFLTALLTRNAVLSDDLIAYITLSPLLILGDTNIIREGEDTVILVNPYNNKMRGMPVQSYQQVMEAQQRLYPDSLLMAVVNDPKLGDRRLLDVLKNQQPTDEHYRAIIDRTELTTVTIADLFIQGDGIPSDTVLYYFFTERSPDSTTIQYVLDNIGRPVPNYIKIQLQLVFADLVFLTWEGYNPLSAYCSNAVNGARIYIETKTEYQYYEADYRGHAQGKAYELLMGMISSIDEPTTFPKSVPDYIGSAPNTQVPALRLKYEPSWQLFSKKTSSPHLPGAYQREEYFYLYDLQNRYARHWTNYDLLNTNKFYVSLFDDDEDFVDTVVYNGHLNSYYTNSTLPIIPEFDGMAKSRKYKMRSLAFQKTTFSKNASESDVFARSEYYNYDARWRFDDLPGPSVQMTFVGDTCIPPASPGNSDCNCIYLNHVFGENELSLWQMQYPLSAYCFYHLGGDGTGWQYSYRVCPIAVDAYACFGDEITSEICQDSEDPLDPNGPQKMVPIAEILSGTLQLRSVSVQVDTFNYLSEKDFGTNKWDRKNKYIAEFSLTSPADMDADNFAGIYKMILPFTSLQTNKILKLNRHLQLALEEDEMGLQTKYYYQKPTFYHYRNTRCNTDMYTSTVYRSTALPVRITVGYGRNDSLSTAYTYTHFAQVASTVDPKSQKMFYEFDGFKRLKKVRELMGTDTVVLTTANYHVWERNVSNSFIQRAAQNYVDVRTYNSGDTTDYSYTRQYVDPLGRTMSTVISYNENNTTHHIYQGSVLYDKWNRAQKSYKNKLVSQPIPIGQTHATPTLLYDYTTVYNEADLEKTPKSRTKKVADFGVNINAPLDKTVRQSHAIANYIYASCELGLSKSELNQIMSPGNTAAFRFFRTQTLDQDNNKSVVYTNAFGQTVGTISYLATNDKVITLFVYDNQGNLSKVINPNKMENTYEYNILGQLFRETTLEAGVKKYMYNKRGQVSVMLDQQLWTGDSLRYRKFNYDIYGRITETGLIKGPEHRDNHIRGFMHYETAFHGLLEDGIKEPICNYVGNGIPSECWYFDYVFSHSSTQDWLTSFWVTERETHYLYPEDADEVVQIVFQDWWNNLPPYFGEKILQPEKKYVYNVSDFGLLSATESYNNRGEAILHTTYGYDQRGNATNQTVYFTEHPTATPVLSVTPSNLLYHYNLQGQVTRQQINAHDAAGQVQYFYTYDGLNRMREIKVLDNGGSPTNATTIVKYDYDDALGLLTKRTHQLDKELVVTDYTYDDRMRLKDISSINKTTAGYGNVLMQHTYFHDGETPVYINPLQTYVPQFGFNHNGNINGVISSYDFDGVHGSAPALFENATVYGYKYDKINRLVVADGLAADFVINAIPQGQASIAAAMQIGDESYVYDKIGNIQRLQRVVSHADLADPTVVSKAEGWNYAYNAYNKLVQVNGIASTPTRSYTYDANGNLLTDSYRNSSVTEYGRAAYSYEVVAGDKEISYLYSIDDQRMYKKVVSPTETTREFYLQDIMGRTVAIRKKVDSSPAGWEYYVNGTEREAKLTVSSHDGMITASEIDFYLHDHLGNTRVVYEPTYEVTLDLHLKINYVADYFPYGKILKEYVNAGDAEKFLTTQHERDQETGLDYRGARYYDSDIARFLSIDPWQANYPSWSTYNYVMGNPIMLIDPTGKGAEDWVMKDNGTIYWDNNANDQASTKQGETYLGKELNFVFNSYIDKNLWDGPSKFNDPSGDKLTSTITLKASENSKGELTGITGHFASVIGDTPIGEGRAFYPGKGGSKQTRLAEKTMNADGTVQSFKVIFEQHASVSPEEEFGLNQMGYRIVDVAQKLVLIQDKNYLWVGGYTNIFPSATLSVNGHKLIQYNQPSFVETHKAPITKDYLPPWFKRDFSYYPSKLYKR